MMIRATKLETSLWLPMSRNSMTPLPSGRQMPIEGPWGLAVVADAAKEVVSKVVAKVVGTVVVVMTGTFEEQLRCLISDHWFRISRSKP